MTDHFERLGLPRRFLVDAATLDREYLARSRMVHPDFHASAATSDLDASMEASALLNEAYATLKSRFARAEYLLSLLGGPTAAEHKAIPPVFLAEMLEAREAVESALGNEGEIAKLDRRFREQEDQLLADAAKRFDSIESQDHENSKSLFEIRGLLNSVKFVQGLLRDLHAD